MKQLLYIRNLLTQKCKTQTTIETLSENLRIEGYTVYPFSNKENKLSRLLDMFLGIIKKSRKTDYVLIDTYSTQNFYYAYLCSQLCRIVRLKYIPLLHGGNLPNRLTNNPRLSKAIFNNAYKTVSPSLYIKSEFEKEGCRNVICIPNAINVTNYPFKERNPTTVNLLSVRSLSKTYNPLLAIRLVKALQND